ncbi:MAG: TatD family hydrolase, partial [Actinomycetota bacterium]|nr:TatD family hydrolase [Actinomycetota bacterium]
RELVARAILYGVEDLVAIGIDVASSQTSARLAHEHGIWFSAGVHPNSASEWDDRARDFMGTLLIDDRCVAVGETGLDFFRDHAAPEQQHAAFRAHIELSKRFEKALVIHTRESLVAALDVLEGEGPPARLVFHCWSGGADLDRALGLGACISFAGNVSFPSAQDLRDAAARVPADRLLVETDSPFLSPVPKRGRPNEPARVALVGAAVAAARGQDEDEVARLTTANARRLFGIDTP